MAEKKIKEQHKKLALKWLACGNGREAAIYAGYAESSARVQATRILGRPEVLEFLRDTITDMQQKEIATVEEVWKYFTSVMRGEITEEVVTSDGVYTVGPKIRDRNDAAIQLGRGYKMFTDRLETEASGTVTIVNDTQLEPEGDNSG